MRPSAFRNRFLFSAVVVHSAICAAMPFVPQGAQTDLYFPHVTNGGPSGAQWQTRFTFINPNASSANVTLTLYSNTGGPLTIDFGNGPINQTTFQIPPNGTVILQGQAGSVPSEGWAYAAASMPVLGNAAFRLLRNGNAQLEITAEPTLPSGSYRSVATAQMGIALANVYSAPTADNVGVYDGGGHLIAQTTFNLAAYGHTSFNLGNIFPSLPSNFTGSVLITPQTFGGYLLGWAVYADSSGVVSSLPDGRGEFPRPQPDWIQDIFLRLVAAYQRGLPDFGVRPQLVISSDRAINALAARDGSSVQINRAMAELLNDSPSELAAVIGHELGHIYQFRTGKYVWYSDGEWDADCWGLLMALYAGYDPYAAAGALGKLAMATAKASLDAQLMQNWEQMAGIDAHASFATRIDNLTGFIEATCSYSQEWQTFCADYKAGAHPHFPALPSVPLMAPRPPSKAHTGASE